jgi:hypothetical protein
MDKDDEEARMILRGLWALMKWNISACCDGTAWCLSQVLKFLHILSSLGAVHPSSLLLVQQIVELDFVYHLVLDLRSLAIVL